MRIGGPSFGLVSIRVHPCPSVVDEHPLPSSDPRFKSGATFSRKGERMLTRALS